MAMVLLITPMSSEGSGPYIDIQLDPPGLCLQLRIRTARATDRRGDKGGAGSWLAADWLSGVEARGEGRQGDVTDTGPGPCLGWVSTRGLGTGAMVGLRCPGDQGLASKRFGHRGTIW